MAQHIASGITPTVVSRPESTLSCVDIISPTKTLVSSGKGGLTYAIQFVVRSRHGFQCNQAPLPGVTKDKIVVLPAVSGNIQQVQSRDGCSNFTVTVQQLFASVNVGFRVRFEEDQNRTGQITPVKKDCILSFVANPDPIGGESVLFTLSDVVSPGPDLPD